jgi:urease accessory protein UreF
LGLGEEETILAYLQQTLVSLISACQRLLPVGQSHATGILWRLKPVMLDTAAHTRQDCVDNDVFSFSMAVNVASMRHTTLPVRLFIS